MEWPETVSTQTDFTMENLSELEERATMPATLTPYTLIIWKLI